MREIPLDAESRLLIAIGFLIGHLNDGVDVGKKAALIMAELQEKLDVRILGLNDFRIGTWINEILGKGVLRQ